MPEIERMQEKEREFLGQTKQNKTKRKRKTFYHRYTFHFIFISELSFKNMLNKIVSKRNFTKLTNYNKKKKQAKTNVKHL